MTISTDFEAIAKRHKRRLTLKYVVLSAGLALVALVLGYMGLNRLTSMNGQYLMAYYNNRIQIAYPNIDVASSSVFQVEVVVAGLAAAAERADFGADLGGVTRSGDAVHSRRRLAEGKQALVESLLIGPDRRGSLAVTDAL